MAPLVFSRRAGADATYQSAAALGQTVFHVEGWTFLKGTLASYPANPYRAMHETCRAKGDRARLYQLDNSLRLG
jgi:hypothetical protein